MKNFGLFGFAVAGAAALGACSSASTTDAAGAVSGQTSAARARFAAGPTALFTKDNGARALSETKRQQASGADAMKGNPLGGSGAGTSTASIGVRSLRVLDVDAGGGASSASCADVAAGKDKGSCACPGGGSVAYDVPNLKALQAQSQGDALPDELSIAFTYQACSMDQKTYGGAMSMLLSKKSVVNVGGSASTAPTAPAAGAGLNMLVVANELTIDDQKLDFAFAMDGGQFYYAPSVDAQGGYVLTELSFTGGTKVHAKNGTFDCSGVDDTGAGQCTSDSGETVPVGSGPGNGAPADDAGLGGD